MQQDATHDPRIDPQTLRSAMNLTPVLVHLVLNGPGLRREILMKRQPSRYEAIVLLTKNGKGTGLRKATLFVQGLAGGVGCWLNIDLNRFLP